MLSAESQAVGMRRLAVVHPRPHARIAPRFLSLDRVGFAGRPSPPYRPREIQMAGCAAESERPRRRRGRSRLRGTPGASLAAAAGQPEQEQEQVDEVEVEDE